MADPVSIITSILGGGLTGIFGAAIQRFADFKTRKLELESDLALRKADAEIMAQEWAARTKIAETEGAAKVELAEAQAFAAALQMEPKLYSEKVKPSSGQGWLLVGLDVLRGSVRPLLTLYLCAITTLVYFQARQLLGASSVTPEQALELTTRIIDTVLYLCTSAVLFWFGSRAKK